MTGSIGTVERVGYAVFECPNCGGQCRTDRALSSENIPNGMRWLGVPCGGTCRQTFTVELTEAV